MVAGVEVVEMGVGWMERERVSARARERGQQPARHRSEVHLQFKIVRISYAPLVTPALTVALHRRTPPSTGLASNTLRTFQEGGVALTATTHSSLTCSLSALTSPASSFFLSIASHHSDVVLSHDQDLDPHHPFLKRARDRRPWHECFGEEPSGR